MSHVPAIIEAVLNFIVGLTALSLFVLLFLGSLAGMGKR